MAPASKYSKYKIKLQKFLSFVLTLVFILILNIYKLVLSPILHFISLGTVVGGCRFYPSCSEYSKQALHIHGAGIKSLKLIFFRLLRCQPFNIFGKRTSGYDPVIKL
jgi:putative component of membrane protein insertase Oxa1/YidC/SpoIIIJ protein YidD